MPNKKEIGEIKLNPYYIPYSLKKIKTVYTFGSCELTFEYYPHIQICTGKLPSQITALLIKNKKEGNKPKYPTIGEML